MSELNVVRKLLADKIDEVYVLRRENAALKAEVASLRINQHTQPKIDPSCETCDRCDSTCMLNLGSTACRTVYVAAQTLDGFYNGYHDTYGCWPNPEDIWNAATKAVEEKFSAANKQSTPCPACGRELECPNGCQSKHRSGIVLM